MGRGLGQAGSSIAGAIEKAGKAAWDGLGNLAESTGNLFTDGTFATDDELHKKYLSEYNNLKNNPIMLAALEDSPEYARITGNAALSAEQRSQRLRELEIKLGYRHVGGDEGFLNRLGNLFSGNGFKTDSQIVLNDIATGNKTDVNILELKDGSTIERGSSILLNGRATQFSDGLTLNTSDGTISLSGRDDFRRLLEGGGGYGSINSADSVRELLDANVKEYYDNFNDGNPNAVNERGSGSFVYENTIQLLGTRPPIDSYDETGLIQRARGLECQTTSMVNVYKSLGIIAPEMTRNEFEKRFTNIFNSSSMGDNRKTATDPVYQIPQNYNEGLRGMGKLSSSQFVDIANGLNNSDWAKLTGMNDKYFYAVQGNGTIDSVIDHINNGYTAQANNTRVIHNDVSGHYVTIINERNGRVQIDDTYEDFRKKNRNKYYDSNNFNKAWYIYFK